MTKQDETRPRDPAELRTKLKFRKAKAHSEIGAHGPEKGTADKSPAPAAKTIGAIPVALAGQNSHSQAPSLEPLLGVQSADGDRLGVRAGEPRHDSPFWSAGEPRGPDYTSLDAILSGLVKQTERYRREWRNKHDKDLEAPPVAANQRTQELYETCGRRLLARYIRTQAPRMLSEDVNPLDFVNWLLAWKPFWDHDTWRLHRAGAIVVVQTIPSPHVTEALAWLYSDPQTESQVGARERLRAHRMEQLHLEKLKSTLRKSSSKVARWLEIWLDAGIYTGLLPAEWPLATVETCPDAGAPHGRRVWLHAVMGHVQNKWLTHRTLEISKFSESAVDTVRQMIGNAREWASEEKFAARQGEIAHLLRETSKMCFRRMELQYDLHSLRQQFIENMRSQYGDAEIAALAGHLCLNKEKKHYSKRRSAWTKIDQVPVPSQQWVARMKTRLDVYLEIQELMKIRLT